MSLFSRKKVYGDEVQGINILEQTTISGGRRVCFFEGPDGVQLEFIELKS